MNEFDFSSIDEQVDAAEALSIDFEPLEDGLYHCQLESFDLRADSGEVKASLKWRVVGPSHAGRILFENLKLRDASGEQTKAVQVCLAKLQELKNATGMAGRRIQDSSEYVGSEAFLKVARRYDDRISAKTGQPYGWGNRVQGYRPVGGAPAQAAPAPAPAQSPGNRIPRPAASAQRVLPPSFGRK